MANFQIVETNKKLFTIISSLVWAINFRSTFKNIDAHMDLGCYSTLKYDIIVILIKNVLCCIINFLVFWYSLQINLSKKTKKILIKTETSENVSFSYEDREERDSLLDSVSQSHKLNNLTLKFLFWLKIIFLIIIIYFAEEAYFMIANNHLLDRLIVCMRNIGILIPTFILSSLLIKKSWHIYKHQLFPSIIIILYSLLMIFYNAFNVPRFHKIFNINLLYYYIIFLLTSLELVLIKYLVDIQFINIFLILGLKGLIGTIIFGMINLFTNAQNFYNFFDKIFTFENEGMYEEFPINQKIIYIISFLIFQYLKIGIIIGFSENHFLSCAMIADVFSFPFYLIEKFIIQHFPISTSATFYLNTIFGVINAISLLIFNEIISFKFCHVDQNMKKNIDERQEIEIQLLNKDVNNMKNKNFDDLDEENEDDGEDEEDN